MFQSTYFDDYFVNMLTPNYIDQWVSFKVDFH